MAIRYNYDIASTQRFVESAINDEFDSFMESRFGSLSESSIGYKTVDIADTDGIDITDTIKGNFDNWEGIVPDDTIGDITAEFDSFLESRFPSAENNDLINEGVFRDNRISNASAGDYGDVVYNNERREILAGRHTQVNTPTTEAVLLSEGLLTRYNLKPFNGKFSNASFKIRKRKTENVDLNKAIKYIQSNILPQADRLINQVANKYMPLIYKTSDERKKKWVDKLYKTCSISLFKYLIGDEYCIKFFISLTNTEITFTGTISDKGDMRFKFNDCVTTMVY